MRLLFIRHGQSEANRDAALDTADPGTDLTELGRRQAEAVPGALADEPIEAIHVSPLRRTLQTAAPLARARGLDPVADPGFAEILAGKYEMSTRRHEAQAYLDLVDRWIGGELDARMPGAQNGHEFLERFDGAVRRIIDSGVREAVVFGHGGASYVWSVMRASGLAYDTAAMLDFSNTGLLELHHDPRLGWEVTRMQQSALGGPAVSSRGADSPFE